MRKDSQSRILDDVAVGINHLKEKRDLVSSQIDSETAVGNQLKDEIAVLNERL